MKNVYLFVFLVVPFLTGAQTDTENYVKSTSYTKGYTQPNVGNALDNEKMETITYSDGMGRPKQTISLRAGAKRENIVQHMEYDELGRQPRQYLPYATQDQMPITTIADYVGSLAARVATENFYDKPKYQYTQNPYSEEVYEASPRSRVEEMGAPGNNWNVDPATITIPTGTVTGGHTVRTGYAFNVANDYAFRYHVEFDSQTAVPPIPLLKVDGTYDPGELSKVTLKDENWTSSDGSTNVTHTFTDKAGRVVLKRQVIYDQVGGTGPDVPINLDTNYVYDDYGNLTFVLSPEGSDAVMNGTQLETGMTLTTALEQFCYKYTYDHRNRLVEKQIPGKGFESIVYDRLDRPVMTQDANLRADNKWLFTKYDVFDRVAYTGIYSGPAITREAAQTAYDLLDGSPGNEIHEERSGSAVNISGTNVYYTNDVKFYISGHTPEVLTVNYYDSYVDQGGLTKPTLNSFDKVLTTQTTGMPTVSKVKVLDGIPPEKWITTLMGYDYKGRVIYTASENPYLRKEDIVESLLDDFTGNVLESLATHTDMDANFPVMTLRDYFNYDHMWRLLTHEQQLNDNPVQLIADNTYDDMGQLTKKEVGGETYVDGYTSIVNVDVSPIAEIAKTDNSSSWNAGLSTKGKVVGEGGVEGKVLTSGKQMALGLYFPSVITISPLIGIDYGFILTDEFVSGSGYKVKTITNGNESYLTGVYHDTNDVFRVEREETTPGNYELVYYKNDIQVYSVTTGVPSGECTGLASFYTPDGKLFRFGLVGPGTDKVLQVVDYDYNVRGWLTDINDVDYQTPEGRTESILDLWHFRIHYNEPTEGMSVVDNLYNGNISQTIWSSINDDFVRRAYSYEYDDIDRLMKANSMEGLTLGAASDHDMDITAYTKNGNIEGLNRYGDDGNGVTGAWDDLQYFYEGNQLTRVSDAATGTTLKDLGFKDGYTAQGGDYVYDANGNMTIDRNKAINGGVSTGGITYNHLNLPVEINIDDTPGTGTPLGTIKYIYDATGVKLKKIYENEGSIITEYAGNYVYSNVKSGGGVVELEFISHPEGYIMPVELGEGEEGYDRESGETSVTTYDYVFQYLDHLGNVRLSYSDKDRNGVIDPATLGEIIEESNYYPFGLKQLGYNYLIAGGNAVAQNWKYNGMEQNQELGLEWYDFGARNYDAALGRWMNIDPLGENSRRWSPYNFAYNNPIYFIDPDGMQAVAAAMPDTVIVTGDMAAEATSQLDASVEGELDISRDADTGELSYERTGEGPLTKDAQQLVDAIDDKSVNVNVNATSNQSSTATPGADVDGGEFQGSTTEFDGLGNAITETYQQVTPEVGGVLDGVSGEPGQTTLHEVVESHLGGVEAQKRGLSKVGPATKADASNPGSVYSVSHYGAPKAYAPQIFKDAKTGQKFVKDPDPRTQDRAYIPFSKKQ